MREFIRVGLAQVNPTVGDFSGNLSKILYFMEKAKGMKADIAVFPELAVCGYPPEDLLIKTHFIRDNIETLGKIIKHTSGITAVAGFVNQDKRGHIYNTAGVMHDGRLAGLYSKMDLPNYGVFDEKRYFKAGERNVVFRRGKAVFGITVCEDIWKKDGAYLNQVYAGAAVLINISASPYHAGKHDERQRLLAARAKETGVFICYANMVGGQDELVFDGGSFVMDPRGRVMASAREFEEGLLVADLFYEASKPAKAPKSFTGRRLRTVVLPSTGVKTSRAPLPAFAHEKFGRAEEIYKALVLGTRDYVRKNGFEKVIIGLSGGIDSALVALIACDAVGRKNVVGISMPSRFSSAGTRRDARLLAENLGIEFEVVPIDGLFTSYLKLLRPFFRGKRPDAAEENLQARIRGNILMAFSNKFGSLVLTTGNKSETAVGYCTLYGDMAGGFAVIKDVPKTLVYKLARFRNDRLPERPIPESVFTRPPTAELKRNQKDEDSIPRYEILDPIITAYVEKDKSVEEIARRMPRNTVRRIAGLIDSNEYKRRQAPPGVKITPKAFGKDRRLPITNRYRED